MKILEAEMDVYLSGADLRRTGWSIFMTVPSGAHLEGSGQVIPHFNGSAAQDAVSVDNQQALEDGGTVTLIWSDAHSGPLQVDGANLAAWFPDVEVDNWSSSDNSTRQGPQVAVTWYLDLNGQDFTYLAGQPPTQFSAGGYWTWKPSDILTVNGGGGALSPGFYMEARSASADEAASNNEFKSGIAFGVAAVAFIAAIQEFVNAATDPDRHGRKGPSDVPARKRRKTHAR